MLKPIGEAAGPEDVVVIFQNTGASRNPTDNPLHLPRKHGLAHTTGSQSQICPALEDLDIVLFGHVLLCELRELGDGWYYYEAYDTGFNGNNDPR